MSLMLKQLLTEGAREIALEDYTGVVYKCICKVNNKIYIGVTNKRLEERIDGHIKLSKKQHPKYLFHKAIKKYGINNFSFNVIDTYKSLNERDKKEMLYIKEYNSFYLTGYGYNMTLGGDGSRGHILSEESLQKIKDARKRQIFTETTRKLWSLHRKGKKLNHGWKISKTAKETGSHKKSEETKEKIRKSLLGRVHTKEYKQKMSRLLKNKLNVKNINEEEQILIFSFYTIEKLGLNKLCKKLRDLDINIGHSSVKRFLESKGIYNLNSISRKN